MRFINVTGYLSTGSSAVIDYLREFKNTAICKTEIRFIRDPDGIIDLDTALTYNWENERASYAVWRFLDASKKWARFNQWLLAPVGHSYKKYITKDYLSITNEYIERMTDYRAILNHYCDSYSFPYFTYVTNRVRKNIEKKGKGKTDIANRRIRKNYFIHPTDEEFMSATRDYIEELFSDISENGKNIVLLDQALPPDNLNYSNRYFYNCLNIVVDRDPRDVYTTNVILMDVIAMKKGSLESGKMFVKHFKTLHEKANYGKDPVLSIRFEDLVLKYDDTTKQIREFLGFDESEHVNPRTTLIPESSSKNVGIYKKYYDRLKPAIDYIYQELKDYCFEG